MFLSLYSSVTRNHPFGLLKSIEWAAKYGYEAIDVRGSSMYSLMITEDSHKTFGYDMLNPTLLSDAAKDDLKQALAEHNIKMTTISSYVPLTMSDPDLQKSAVRMVKKYIDLAAELQCPGVRTIGNTTNPTPNESLSMDKAFDNHIKLLKQVVPYAESKGIVIEVETYEGTVTPDAGSCLRLKEALGSEAVGIVLDPVNLYFAGMGMAEIEQEMDKLAGDIYMIHIKNVKKVEEERAEGNIGKQIEHQFSWTDTDDGDIDWEKLINRAAGLGFSGPLVYEYINPFKGMALSYWYGLEDPETCTARAGKHLGSIIKAL